MSLRTNAQNRPTGHSGRELSDASLLFEHSRFGNAYYLAGYAVEIGLKACVSRQILAETIPDRTFLKDIFVHDFGRLVNLAGLAAELKHQRDTDPRFGSNWITVSEWRPDVRYEGVDRYSAGLMLMAVGSSDGGVLEWIKAYW